MCVCVCAVGATILTVGATIPTAVCLRSYYSDYLTAGPIQFMTGYSANRHETVQARRHEYEPPCPPPVLIIAWFRMFSLVVSSKHTAFKRPWLEVLSYDKPRSTRSMHLLCWLLLVCLRVYVVCVFCLCSSGLNRNVQLCA